MSNKNEEFIFCNDKVCESDKCFDELVEARKLIKDLSEKSNEVEITVTFEEWYMKLGAKDFNISFNSVEYHLIKEIWETAIKSIKRK